jgi:hypothetical protein
MMRLMIQLVTVSYAEKLVATARIKSPAPEDSNYDNDSRYFGSYIVVVVIIIPSEDTMIS